MTMAGGDPNPTDPKQRTAYTKALVSEVRLLVRTISNDPKARLSDLKLSFVPPSTLPPTSLTAASGSGPASELGSAQILNMISAIEETPRLQSDVDSIAFLQMVRDALIPMTAPATGLTIAYTTLVMGGRRPKGSESSFALAEKAYGLLRWPATRHRLNITLCTAFAFVLTVVAVWLAADAARGKGLMQNLDLLRVQQAAISAEKLKLETSLDKPVTDEQFADALKKGDRNLLLSLVPLCDRHLQRRAFVENVPQQAKLVASNQQGSSLQLRATPAERDVCGRDFVLSQNIKLVHEELKRYEGTPWSPLAVHPALLRLTPTAKASAATTHPSEDVPPPDDVELQILSRLQMSTNYALPFLFGIIGSLVYVLTDHFKKLRANLLDPRDRPLLLLRFILGLVIAASVSLLVSASARPDQPLTGLANGMPAPGSLVQSLTLSVSGLAFLAGFGAEAVFKLLQDLVDRVFADPK